MTSTKPVSRVIRKKEIAPDILLLETTSTNSSFYLIKSPFLIVLIGTFISNPLRSRMTKVSSEKQVAEHNAMHGGIHKKYIIPESRHIEWHPIQHPGAAGPI